MLLKWFVKIKCFHVIFSLHGVSLTEVSDAVVQILSYVSGEGGDVPFLLLGRAGSGKSSIMAKIADMVVTKAMQGAIPG